MNWRSDDLEKQKAWLSYCSGNDVYTSSFGSSTWLIQAGMEYTCLSIQLGPQSELSTVIGSNSDDHNRCDQREQHPKVVFV